MKIKIIKENFERSMKKLMEEEEAVKGDASSIVRDAIERTLDMPHFKIHF